MSHRFQQLIFVLIAAAAIVWFTPALLVFAQDYVPLAPIKAEGTSIEFTGCNPNLYTPDPTDPAKKRVIETPIGDLCLPKYLTTIYNMGIALAGLFLVFAIVRGGFTLMFTDSILGKLEGKKIILQAMGGAVIVFSSYLLMNTINPQLAENLNLSLKFPRIQIKKFESILDLVPAGAKQVEAIQEELKKQLDEVNPKIGALEEAATRANEEGDFDEGKRLKGQADLLGDVQTKIKLAKHNLQQGIAALWVTSGLTKTQRIAAAEGFRSAIYTQTISRAGELSKQGFAKEAEPIYEAAFAAYQELNKQINWLKQNCDSSGKRVIPPAGPGGQARIEFCS